MFLKIFRGTGPGVMILIFLISAGIWASSVIVERPSASCLYDLNPMPLYALLKSLTGGNIIAGSVISFVLVLTMASLLVNFNTTVFFITERTFLPAIIYVLLTGIFPHFQVLNPVLPACILLMIALIRILGAYRKNGTAYNFFDASVLIGSAALFYANMIWFGVLAIVGIAILRTGNLRELLLSVLGLCTPLLLTAGVYYVSGKELMDLVNVANYNLFTETGDYYFSRITITGLVITGICIIIGIVYLYSVLYTKKIKARKTFTELIWTLIICITIYFAVPSTSLELIFIAGIPLSYILAHYFIFSRNRILPGVFFPVLFLFVIIVQVIFIKM